MLVAAAKATELPKLGRPRMKLRVHASQTMHHVVFVLGWLLGIIINKIHQYELETCACYRPCGKTYVPEERRLARMHTSFANWMSQRTIFQFNLSLVCTHDS